MKQTAITKRFLFLRQISKIEIMDYRNENLQKLLTNRYDCILYDETHDLAEIYDDPALFFLPIWTVLPYFSKSVGLEFFGFCFVLFFNETVMNWNNTANVWAGKPRWEMKSEEIKSPRREVLIPLCHQVKCTHTKKKKEKIIIWIEYSCRLSNTKTYFSLFCL